MEGDVRVRIVEDLGGLEFIEAIHRRPRFPRHAHATYALGAVLWGTNRFRYRGAFHTATAGALCTVTPDEPHAVEPAGDGGFAYLCLYPPIELMRLAAESAGGRRLTGTLALAPVIRDAEMARRIRALFEAEATGTARLVRETQLLALLARAAVRHATAPVTPGAQQTPSASALASARDYLAAHCVENVSLTRLASAVGLDPFALIRGFSRAYGLPPHCWLVQERVRRAQALLRAGLSPSATAAQVGFSDQSHLNRHFKRVLGVTPGRYRRAARAGAER
ncbi:MAG TPA: AraC family transcriptional regulator [Anaeromyxobacteraceae bacterium]|nr:AraC family transcriptional regulator [Anaeromyxobacteraceae bacterium]